MTSLVILAAGLGSRFGGNKQLAEFGQQQLTLMEYNLVNAVNAGFTQVVFVIRPELEKLLNQQIIPRLPKGLDHAFAYQTFNDLPHGCKVSPERNKPLGTAHALWCCRNLLDSNFAVINADDFYGKQSFSLLLQQTKETPEHYLMVAYQLQNTLSEFGGVNRGLCKVDEQDYLLGVEECEQIQLTEHGISGVLSESQQGIKLTGDYLISMNCWLFTTDIFIALEQAIIKLLHSPEVQSSIIKPINVNAECYLPAVVMQQIQQKSKQVKVLSTNDSWFGLTYPQDSAQVDEKVTALFTKK
jgi:NDP-sugar pyrophosphorylase family protein